MTSRNSMLAAVSVLAFWTHPPLASAQVESGDAVAYGSADEQARAAFDAGRAAFDDGHYEEAYASFAEAHRLSRRPELLYNMGRSADRLRRDALAIEHYRAFLSAVPDTPRRLELERRIATIEGAERPEHNADLGAAEPAPTSVPAPNVWEEWWLWTIVGVVVVGGAVAIGVGVGTANMPIEEPIPGDVGPGGVVFALHGAF